MQIEVLLFASLKDEVGPTFAVEIPEGADVGALRQALNSAHSSFARFGRKALVAVNEEYADDSRKIEPGDVVAILPPVAGG